MASWQLILHPKVFAELQGLVFMAGWANAPECHSLKERNENAFDKLIFAGGIKECCKPASFCIKLLSWFDYRLDENEIGVRGN